MCKREKALHAMSVLAFMFLAVCFQILGGGSDVEAISMNGMASYDVNITLPEAEAREMAGDRLEAIEIEQRETSSMKRRRNLEQDSFDWLTIGGDSERSQADSASKPIVASLQSKSEEIVRGRTVSNDHSVSRRSEPTVSSNASETDYNHDRIMRSKRAEIEREWGINLSDYGYTKYETADASQKSAIDAVNDVEQPGGVSNGFYGLGGDRKGNVGHIKAVIHGEHRNVTRGSMIKMRLLEPVEVDGFVIPANSFIYGQLNYGGGRAMVNVENINYRDRIVPFQASLYDRDGFEGLYVPDNIISDAERNTAGQMISSANVNVTSTRGLINSAVNALTNGVRNAASSAVRDPKITISANYLITLKLR